jgi:hypothetical protein
MSTEPNWTTQSRQVGPSSSRLSDLTWPTTTAKCRLCVEKSSDSPQTKIGTRMIWLLSYRTGPMRQCNARVHCREVLDQE